jgi:hypothetical protein
MTLPATRNDELLSRLTTYLVAIPDHVRHLDLAPFGVTIPEGNVVDPLRTSSETFLRLLQTLDKLTFGPEGMPMPRWVFFNGAELPGAIYGFALPVGEVDDDVRAQMGVPEDYEGLIPLSMYIAIPVRPPHTWFGHNLASLNPVFPQLKLKGLASVTKALALKCFGCTVQIGATQWDSEALHIHTRFGPLDVMTAWTPAHSEPWTLTYRFDITDDKLRYALGDPSAEMSYPEPDFEILRSDEEAQRALHMRIEAGEKFVLAGRPSGHGQDMRVPITKVG